MSSQIDQIRNNFFKVFVEWANGQYELQVHADHGQILEMKYDTLDVQPINSVINIGNQSVHRLFVPTNDTVIAYDVTIKNNFSKGIATFGDYDMYIALIEGDLHDKITDSEFKQNLIYIIPAGQYYNLITNTNAMYYQTIRKRETFIENAFPSKLKHVEFNESKPK